jgi:hypothetical protein
MVAFVLHPGTLRTPVVLACALAWFVPAPVVGMVSVRDGNRPIEHFNDTDWPGLRAVVNDESRVLFTEGPMT